MQEAPLDVAAVQNKAKGQLVASAQRGSLDTKVSSARSPRKKAEGGAAQEVQNAFLNDNIYMYISYMQHVHI